MKHLVLLGGGLSHLRLMRELAAAPLPGTQVTWVVPNILHVDPLRLPAWVAGRCSTEQISLNLEPLARSAGVALVEGDVMLLDAAQREITLGSGRTLVFDALSVCTHAGANRDAIVGAREHALFTRPVEHFIRLWDALLALAAQQTLSLVVVGGQPRAIEMAMAVQQRLNKRARVALVTHGGAPLVGYSFALQNKVRDVLKRGQVTLFEDRCEALSSRQMQLGQGMRLACDAPLLVLEDASPLWLTSSDLQLDSRGMLVTGPTLQSLSHPFIFADGELAARSDRAFGSTPLAALYPRGEPFSLGHNLRRFLAGGELAQDLRPPRGIHALSCGDGSAVASVGGFAFSGRWVGRLKARADDKRLEPFRQGVVAAPPVLSAAEALGERISEPMTMLDELPGDHAIEANGTEQDQPAR